VPILLSSALCASVFFISLFYSYFYRQFLFFALTIAFIRRLTTDNTVTTIITIRIIGTITITSTTLALGYQEHIDDRNVYLVTNHYTVSIIHAALYCCLRLLSAVFYLLSAVSCLLSTVCCLLAPGCTLLSAV
jgi:hypothetical protein